MNIFNTNTHYCIATPQKMSKDIAQLIAQHIETDAQSQINCTFSITKFKYTSQFWYTCKTCWGDTETSGCCVGCAATCHKGHDIGELRYSTGFFCDCATEKECKIYKPKVYEGSSLPKVQLEYYTGFNLKGYPSWNDASTVTTTTFEDVEKVLMEYNVSHYLRVCNDDRSPPHKMVYVHWTKERQEMFTKLQKLSSTWARSEVYPPDDGLVYVFCISKNRYLNCGPVKDYTDSIEK